MHDQRGIALPLTLFVVTLMTIVLAAAFARVGAEHEMAVGAGDAITALGVAQTGLQRYLAYRDSLRVRPPDGDSLRMNVLGGYADVVARVVRRPADTLQTEMYVVRSTGRVIVPTQGFTTQASRTVAQFATWQVPTIRRLAAYVAANGGKDSNPKSSVQVNGNDSCGVMPATQSMLVGTPNNFSRGQYSPGAPIAGSSGQQVADTTGIDWTSITSHGLQGDYTTVHTGDSTYKSSVVLGDATITASGVDVVGTGLLVVTGDLTITGTNDVYWYGVVIVGGQIAFDAPDTYIRGLVFSGLNEALGGSTSKESIGGQKRVDILYASCVVDAALAGMSGFAPVPNGWVENWATY